MKKLTVFALVALLLVSVFAFTGCKQEESGDVLKVGLVCIGSKDDKGIPMLMLAEWNMQSPALTAR